MELIRHDPTLPGPQKAQWLSALRRLARYLDKDPAHLPARMMALRIGVAKLHHVPLDVSKKSLQNLKSNVKAALRHLGALEIANLRTVALTPEWRDLHDRLDPDTMKRLRRGLCALIRYCSHGGIHPSTVTNQTVADFVQALSESSFCERANDQHREICKIWNEAVGQVRGWPAITLEVPSFRAARRSLPESDFPGTFQADVEAYLDWLSGKDLLSEEAPARPCQASTCDLRRKMIYLAASAAVEGGVPLESLETLASLVRPTVARVVLNRYLERNDNDVRTFVIDLSVCLASIARRWCKLGDRDLEELGRLTAKLGRHCRAGLTDKNLQAVRLLKDPANWARLCTLPAKLMAEAQAGRLARHKAAVQAQMAAAIQILIVAPMRISNLAALSLVQNVLQPGGLNGPILLHIPEQDVKNGVALEYPVPQVVSDLVLTYKREFRNRLKGSNSEWLFPGEGGQAKQSKTLSEQIIKVIQRELGIRLTPHQMRHAAAALILEAEPGNYELVRRVLGHKNIQTTINFYVGLETAAAAKQYAALALRHVHTDASLRV
jgi:integrase